MSFVTEVVARRLATVPRAMAASTPHSVTAVSSRTFTTSVSMQRNAAETVKDGLKTVDRTISDKLVDGINIGSTVAQKVKEASEDIVPGKATGKAAELRGETKGKASEVAGEAKGMASEAKGKASELAGKAKGKLDEATS